jgi:hypothetical protein
VDLQMASHGTPFRRLPHVDLRGVPVMRCAGNRLVSAVVEARRQFQASWRAAILGGAGAIRSERGR